MDDCASQRTAHVGPQLAANTSALPILAEKPHFGCSHDGSVALMTAAAPIVLADSEVVSDNV